jgi:hypothetical protein
MAKVSNVNILIPSVATSGVAYCLYYLKETLKSAGWKVLAASDGTTYTTYAGGTTGIDQIASVNSGSNGMNNSGAWFRITDPDSIREFVFMRGSTALNGTIKYSRSSKFSSGSPNATTLPTTGTSGDGAVILGTGSDSTTTTSSHSSAFIATTSTARLHIVTENSSNNGVYSWYMYPVSTITNTLLCLFSHEAILSGSHSSADNDPSYFFVCSNGLDPISAISTTFAAAALRSWFKYGLEGSNFDRSLAAAYQNFYSSVGWNFVDCAFPANNGTNPYDGKEYGIQFLVYSANYPKGFSTSIKFAGMSTIRNYPFIYDRGTEDATICISSYFIFPWTSENVDVLTSP